MLTQIRLPSSDDNDPMFVNTLQALHNIHHFKLNTFDALTHRKPTDNELEEHEFTFRLMTRQ